MGIVAIVLGILGVAVACLFIFLEKMGMLRRRWLLGTIGIVSVLLFATAAGLVWHTRYSLLVIVVLMMLGILWVLNIVSEKVRNLLKAIRPHITFGSELEKQNARIGMTDEETIMTAQEKKQAAWWTNLSSNDEQQISNKIYVTRRSTELKFHLKNPTVEFTFEIINATVFQVEIGKTARGKIIYNNEKQSFDPEVTLLGLAHGERGNLKISQRLFPEIAKDIQTQIDASKEGADINFGFQSLQIGIVATLPDGTPLKSYRDWYLTIQPPNVGDHFRNLNLIK